MRTGTDECNLGAVNLDGQASLGTGVELPDDRKPAASQRSTCGFQGYGITYETVAVKTEGEIMSAVAPALLKVTSILFSVLPRLAVTSTPDSLLTVGSSESRETMVHVPWMLIMRYACHLSPVKCKTDPFLRDAL